MARPIIKPKEVKESELKDVVCPVEIEINFPEVVVIEEVKEVVVPVVHVKVPIASAPLTIPFSVWFHKKSTNTPKVKISYKEAILAHFLAVGLRDEELPEKYETALKNFGL
jgi:hypothetical protein